MIMFASGFSLRAQNDTVQERTAIVIPPLFEYISAPDSLADINARSNYVVAHFWDPMDFSLNGVGQIPLNHAFAVYATPMRWADKEVVDESIKNLIEKLKKNPTLLLQFTKAAEDNLYSSSASVWIDDAYIPFLNALAADKKINVNRKARYIRQLESLQRSMKGKIFPLFAYTQANGDKESLKISTPLTLIEFGNPSCVDCRLAKIKLDSDSDLEKMVKEGKLAIYFIVPDAEAEEGWDIELASYPYSWHSGAGEALDDIYDIRNTPTFYLLDGNGTIIEKNQPTETMIQTILNIVKENADY